MYAYFVRHGQATWNQYARIQGVSDPPLSPLGIRQATLTAIWAKTLHCSKIAASDLVRAFHTACIISAETDIPVVPTRLLRERDLFEFEGIRIDELKEKCSTSSDMDTTLAWQEYPYIESDLSLASRVAKLLNLLKAETNPILVTHAGVINAYWRTYCHIDRESPPHIPTGSVLACDIDLGKIELIYSPNISS